MSHLVKHLIRYLNIGDIMCTIEEPERFGTSMSTISGEAFYSHTEVEDDNENWNDVWCTINGEYVRHEGNKHHIYIVR